jgi:hypothetical protein
LIKREDPLQGFIEKVNVVTKHWGLLVSCAWSIIIEIRWK